MEGNFLLFDSKCPQCSAVAKRLRDLDIHDLTVESLHDPRVVEMFAEAGRPVPDKPALVHATAQGLTVHTGFAMRMRLARMLGVRRAADIAGLVAMEAGAHLTRRDDDAERRVSRRTMLGGTAAAGVGALVFGTAASSPAAANPGAPTEISLDAAAKSRLLSSPTLRQAGGVWGEVDETAVSASVTEDGKRIATVPHRGDVEAITIMNVDDPDSPAITMTAGADDEGIRYFLAATGTPLAEHIVRDGEPTIRQLDASAAPPNALPAPQGVAEFIVCFVRCFGRTISRSCINNCIGCVSGSFLSRPVNCARCVTCAGSVGVSCARQCANLL